MRKINVIAMALAVPGMVFAATAQASVTRSSDAMNGAARAGVCNVQVHRSEAPGVFSINRETLQDGSCVCNARTGPASQGGSAEAALGALLQTRECSGGNNLASARSGNSGGGLRGSLGTTPLILGALAGSGLVRGGTSTGR